MNDEAMSKIENIKAAIPDFGDVQVKHGVSIFDDDQEEKYQNSLKNNDEKNRKYNMKKRLETRDMTYFPQYRTIKKWHLGGLISRYRPDIWQMIKNETYPGMNRPS